VAFRSGEEVGEFHGGGSIRASVSED